MILLCLRDIRVLFSILTAGLPVSACLFFALLRVVHVAALSSIPEPVEVIPGEASLPAILFSPLDV
jgi:hypothetical protein